jgi:hypothetical protein
MEEDDNWNVGMPWVMLLANGRLIELTLRSIVATLSGFTVVIIASFWHLHGEETLRTEDFRLITHKNVS